MSHTPAREWFRCSGRDKGPIMTDLYTHFKDLGSNVTKVMHPEFKDVVIVIYTSKKPYDDRIAGIVDVHEPKAMDRKGPFQTGLHEFAISLRGTNGNIRSYVRGVNDQAADAQTMKMPDWLAETLKVHQEHFYGS